jgi:hypothetical protein
MKTHTDELLPIATATLVLLAVAGTSTPARPDTGFIRAVVTKVGLVVGVGGGRGTLIFHDHSYPVIFSGLSLGVTVAVSSAKLSGTARNLQRASDIEGTYSAFGSGGALAAGWGGVRLKNAKGVVLELSGPRAGVELSMAMSGVTVRLR